MPPLRRLGAVYAYATVDFITVLALVGVLFSVARGDSFLYLRPQDIQDQGPGSVHVVLSHLKEERRLQLLDPAFERLPATQDESAPIWTPQEHIPLFLVAVFRLLHSRVVLVGVPFLAQCDSNQQLICRLSHLSDRAHVPQQEPGRSRRLFTVHSSRVAAVCYLLKAGLPETVTGVLVNWSSDQIKWYANRLAFNPGVVSDWPFFNPSINVLHSDPALTPPPKRRRVRDTHK